jgi:hypothetical protein
MDHTGEYIAMTIILLVPCVVLAGLLIWHHRTKPKDDPKLNAFKEIVDGWTKGVETRIEEQFEDQSPEEVAG